MGHGCIFDLVNGFHSRIDRRIKTDGIIRTCNIQIDGSGDTNGIDAQS